MSEYDLICDACGQALAPDDGIVSWREDRDAKREEAFALTHVACVPARANATREARMLAWPNGYLQFFGERFDRLAAGWRVDDASSLQGLLNALAPFVMRPDTGGEMDGIRAASFGARPGVKFGDEGKGKAGAKEVEGGK